jgi:hypothetical protein
MRKLSLNGGTGEEGKGQLVKRGKGEEVKGKLSHFPSLIFQFSFAISDLPRAIVLNEK